MPPAKKKGSKKNANSINAENQDDTTIVNEPIVLQLPITNVRMDQLIETEHIQSVLKYNPNIVDPQPYIPEDNFSTTNDCILYDTDTPDNTQDNTQDNTHNNIHERNPNTIQNDLTLTNTVQTKSQSQPHTPHGTNCFWCCHQIPDIEYGMPIRYDVFHHNFTTYGSYCSLQCAAAYNYSINMGCDRAWEIHSWIQLLGKKYGFKGPIRPAPSRYLLKMFHGPLTIEEFRKAHTNLLQTYVLNIPPFIHVSSQIECINTSFLDKDGPIRNETGLKNTTKRKQPPIPQHKGELEQKMNLEFTTTTT
jgi:hypothetical protein